MARLSIPSPAALRTGYGLRVIDYTDTELAGTADATGLAVLATDYLQQDHIMRVERIVVTGDSTATTQITVIAGDDISRPIRHRDGTPFPPGQIAVSEYPSYLTINPTLCLTITIDGANPGDQFAADVQYQLVQKVLGQRQWPSS